MKGLTLALDDRREIWTMLKRLTPRERIAITQKWCGQATGKKIVGVQVLKHGGTVEETYRAMLELEVTFGLDIGQAALELVRWVRRK